MIVINGWDGKQVTPFSLDASPNNFIFGVFLLAFSGNYVTGGDTLDFTNAAGVNGPNLAAFVPSLSGIITAFAEGNGPTASQQGGGGYYATLAGASPSTWKIKVFSSGGAEIGAGAYPAAVTTDIVYLQVIWRKFT
jgi:hypothetical protein